MGISKLSVAMILYSCWERSHLVTAWEADQLRSLHDEVDSSSDIVDDAEYSDTDWIMIVVISLVSAFFVFVFGISLGYVSILDDAILRRYKEEGDMIVADVACADLARGRRRKCKREKGSGSQAAETTFAGDAEYIAIVEYFRELSDNYQVRVRKQVRIRESDFIYEDLDATLTVPPGTSIESSIGGSNKKNKNTHVIKTTECDDLVDPEALVPTKNPLVLVDRCSSFYRSLETRKLKILVMPNKPKSGYPLGQVERSQTLSYRLPTIGLVASIYMLVIFCLSMAIFTIVALDDEKQRHLGWKIVIVFGTITLLLIPGIHLTRYSKLRDLLEAEYFESADFAPSNHDDDDDDELSISTWGSDPYFAMEPVGDAPP